MVVSEGPDVASCYIVSTCHQSVNAFRAWPVSLVSIYVFVMMTN